MSRTFQTGLEPLLEKVALAVRRGRMAGAQPALPVGIPKAPAPSVGQQAAAHASATAAPAAAPPAAPPGATAATRAPSRGLGALGAGMALPALAIGGGLAYGALRQNDEDAQKLRQIHVPMTGSIYG